MAKKYKLAKKDFPILYKKAKRDNTKFFNLVFLYRKNQTPLFSVVISKKVAKLATERNKTKRLIYELVKNNINKFPSNINLIIHCRKKIDDHNKKNIKNEFIAIIARFNKKNSFKDY